MGNVRRNSSRRSRSTVVQMDNDDEREGRWYQWFLGNEFYRRTHMCGLAHINSANSRVEIALWYTIVAVFTVVMINDVQHLVAEWREQQTVTKMTMVFKKTIKIPYGTLCVFEPLLSFDHMTKLADAAFWRESIAQLNSTDVLLNHTTRWPYELFLLSTVYFSQLTRASGVSQSQSQSGRTNGQHYSNETKQQRIELARLFHEQVEGLGVSDRQLLDTFSAQLHILFGLDMEHKHQQQSIRQPAAISALTWIDGAGERFCFRFDTTNLTISAPHDRLTVGMDSAYHKFINESISLIKDTTALLPPESKPNVQHHGGSNHRTEISLHLAELIKSNVISIADTYRVRCCRLLEASFEITGVYKRVRECSKKSDHRDCQNDCRRRLIERHCNCTPLFFDENINKNINKNLNKNNKKAAVTCTIEQLESCQELKDESDESCWETCLPHCTQLTYKTETYFRWSDWHSRTDDDSTFFGLKLMFPIAKFALFQERYGSSWQNFIGNVGGVIDFWLGASFLSLVHLVFYLCKQAYYRLNGQLPERRRVSALSHYVEEPEMPFAERWSSVHCKRGKSLKIVRESPFETDYGEEAYTPIEDRWSGAHRLNGVHCKRSKSLKVVRECPFEEEKDADDLMINMSGATPRRCASISQTSLKAGWSVVASGKRRGEGGIKGGVLERACPGLMTEPWTRTAAYATANPYSAVRDAQSQTGRNGRKTNPTPPLETHQKSMAGIQSGAKSDSCSHDRWQQQVAIESANLSGRRLGKRPPFDNSPHNYSR
uniref:Uncharacterized protein n=1 Tax=Plectus sambesii TaxID=2011161 RepID=A0A914XKJ1_9BILA